MKAANKRTHGSVKPPKSVGLNCVEKYRFCASYNVWHPPFVGLPAIQRPSQSLSNRHTFLATLESHLIVAFPYSSVPRRKRWPNLNHP